MNTYEAFYRGKRTEVKAMTSLKAQEIAADQFKAKKRYDVVVVLVEKEGQSIVHKPQDLTS